MPVVMARVAVMAMKPAMMARPLRGIVGDIRRGMLVDAKDAFHAADHAAHDASDHGADRPRLLITHIRAVGDAPGNALRLRRPG